jgi:hypothetical protein
VTPWDGTQRDFDLASGTYFETLAETELADEESRVATDAYAEYARAVQEAWASPELQRRAVDAQRRYADAVACAWAPPGPAERLSEAYRDYVRALRAAWAAVDEDAIDPTTLGTIAGGMQAVASTTWLSSAGTVTEPIREGG